MKFNKQLIAATALSALILLTAACGNSSDSGANANAGASPSQTAPASPSESAPAADAADEEILIVIDQTQKPIEGNSFDFLVNKRPEGYALSEMQWVGKSHKVVNTVQEAIEHGGNGEDGFYISGDGQFMGFFYPDELKGEEGEVVFVFKNDAGKELTWKKQITLK